MFKAIDMKTSGNLRALNIHIIVYLVISLSGCAGPEKVETPTVSDQIESNKNLSKHEQQFAKRYYNCMISSLAGSAAPSGDKQPLLDLRGLQSNVYKKWGLGLRKEFTPEETLYIYNIDEMARIWDMYSSVDMSKLNAGEKTHLKDMHDKYGPGKVNLREETRKSSGKLQTSQEIYFDMIEAVTGSSEFDDADLIFIYRMWGGNSIAPPPGLRKQSTSSQPKQPISLGLKDGGRILSVTSCGEDKLRIVASYGIDRKPSGVEFAYKIFDCDLAGNVLKAEDIHALQKGFITSSKAQVLAENCNKKSVLIWSATKEYSAFEVLAGGDGWIDDRIYITDEFLGKNKSRLLISTKGQKRRLSTETNKWWFFGTADKGKLFVTVSSLPQRKNDTFIPIFQWLRCYDYDGQNCVLEKEVPIDDETHGSVRVECGLDRDDIVVWQILRRRDTKSQIKTLRVAKWTGTDELKWTNCFEEHPMSASFYPPIDQHNASVIHTEVGNISGDAWQDTFIGFENDKVWHKFIEKDGWNDFMGLRHFGGSYGREWCTIDRYTSNLVISFFDSDLNLITKEKLSLQRESALADYHLCPIKNNIHLVMLNRDKTAFIVKELKTKLE